MILVTGATGKVGSEAVRLLGSKDESVRALVRDRRKAQGLSRAGAELAEGDFDESATLDAAMNGVTRVLLISPGGPPEQELTVVESARRAGVKSVVKLTARASTESPIARQRWHARVEQGLISSGMAYTLLRSNAFMQNTFMLAPSIARTSSFGSCIGQGRVGMVDTHDVADVAATIIADPAAHEGRTYELSGPELISYADVAATLSRLLDRAVTFHPRSRAEDEAEMLAAGLPQPVAAMNALALSMFAQGDAAWLSDDVHTLLERPPRSYEQFAAINATAFT